MDVCVSFVGLLMEEKEEKRWAMERGDKERNSDWGPTVGIL